MLTSTNSKPFLTPAAGTGDLISCAMRPGSEVLTLEINGPIPPLPPTFYRAVEREIETALPLPFIRLPVHALFPDSVAKCTDVSRIRPSFDMKQVDPA